VRLRGLWREGVAKDTSKSNDDADPVESRDGVTEECGGDANDEHAAHGVQDDVRDGAGALQDHEG